MSLKRKQPMIVSNEEMDAFLSELSEESDRAAALLGAAVLDDLLGQTLAATFTSADAAKELLDNGRPLGTFGARIAIARAIGVISQEEFADLNRVREIRNDFAHMLHRLSFSDHSIRERCKHFSCLNVKLAKDATLRAEIDSNPRLHFNYAVAGLSFQLGSLLLEAEAIEERSCPW